MLQLIFTAIALINTSSNLLLETNQSLRFPGTSAQAQVPPVIETQVEYFTSPHDRFPSEPPRNRQRYAVELRHITIDRPLETTPEKSTAATGDNAQVRPTNAHPTPGHSLLPSNQLPSASEMLAKIEEIRKAGGVLEEKKYEIITYEGIRCRHREGFEACPVSQGNIKTRSFIEAARKNEPDPAQEIWEFIGQSFSARPYLDQNKKLFLEYSFESDHLNFTNGTFIVKISDQNQIQWVFAKDTKAFHSSVAVLDEEYILLGGMYSTSDKTLPDGRKITVRREYYNFIKTRRLPAENN